MMGSISEPSMDIKPPIASGGGFTAINRPVKTEEADAVAAPIRRPRPKRAKAPKPEPTREEQILARLDVLDEAIKNSTKIKKIRQHEDERKELLNELGWLRHDHGNMDQSQPALKPQLPHADGPQFSDIDHHHVQPKRSNNNNEPEKILQTRKNNSSEQTSGSSLPKRAVPDRSVRKYGHQSGTQPYENTAGSHSYGKPINPQAYGDAKDYQGYTYRRHKDNDRVQIQNNAHVHPPDHLVLGTHANQQQVDVPSRYSQESHWSGIYNQRFEQNLSSVSSAPMTYPQVQHQTPVSTYTPYFSPYPSVTQHGLISNSGSHQMLQSSSVSHSGQHRDFTSESAATGDFSQGPPSGPSTKGTPNSSKIREPPSALSGGIPEPTMQYRLRASAPSWTLQTPQPTLLVLDLNGTLLYRSNRAQPKSFVARPMTSLFLEYVLSKFSLMIWSSAQPENVHHMVNKLFPLEADRNRLLAVWGRDRFDLSEKDYNRRVQVYKRLEKVWGEPAIQARHPRAAEGVMWDQTNTILLDDSNEKARSEPWNLCEVPEFTNGKRGVVEPPDTLRQVAEFLELCLWQGNVSAFMRERPFQLSAGQHNGNGAPALLGIPGIPGSAADSSSHY